MSDTKIMRVPVDAAEMIEAVAGHLDKTQGSVVRAMVHMAMDGLDPMDLPQQRLVEVREHMRPGRIPRRGPNADTFVVHLRSADYRRAAELSQRYGVLLPHMLHAALVLLGKHTPEEAHAAAVEAVTEEDARRRVHLHISARNRLDGEFGRNMPAYAGGALLLAERADAKSMGAALHLAESERA